MSKSPITSRIPGFYEKSLEERLARIAETGLLSADAHAFLALSEFVRCTTRVPAITRRHRRGPLPGMTPNWRSTGRSTTRSSPPGTATA